MQLILHSGLINKDTRPRGDMVNPANGQKYFETALKASANHGAAIAQGQERLMKRSVVDDDDDADGDNSNSNSAAAFDVYRSRQMSKRAKV